MSQSIEVHKDQGIKIARSGSIRINYLIGFGVLGYFEIDNEHLAAMGHHSIFPEQVLKN